MLQKIQKITPNRAEPFVCVPVHQSEATKIQNKNLPGGQPAYIIIKNSK